MKRGRLEMRKKGKKSAEGDRERKEMQKENKK